MQAGSSAETEYARRKGLVRVLLCTVPILITIALTTQVLAGDEEAPELNVVWSLPHQGGARFCYDQAPAVIYFQYDPARKVTSIEKKELSGDQHVIAEFPENPNERSLSCSDDGDTIAAVNGALGPESLFLLRGARSALYRFSRYYPYSVAGVNSLLSPDGNSIALPEIPQLISGQDILKEMHVFASEKGNSAFFVGESTMYFDSEATLDKYQLVENEWRKLSKLRMPTSFEPTEIARCGQYDVASLQNDVIEKSRFMVLNEGAPSSSDWLARVGIRKVLQKYRDTVKISGRYQTCAFPLVGRTVKPWMASGLARSSESGVSIFSFQQSPIALADEEVSFSKDGCYALLDAFSQLTETPQFTMPQEIRLLSAPPAACGR